MRKSVTPPYRMRHYVVLGGLMFGFALLAGRAVDLRLNHHDFLQRQGDARHLRVVRVPAHRGIITDRHGEPLAISTPVESLWVNPRELATERGRWGELTAVLGLKSDTLHRVIAERIEREFVYLRRHVAPDVARKVLSLGLKGVYRQREYRRYYPHAEISAHVVGFTDIDGKGREGMELAFNDWLEGQSGAKRVVRDRLGRTIDEVESIRAPRQGHQLRLSIDQRLQYLAYRTLKAAVQRHQARSASLVLVDSTTGEVLAAVNQPSYNPNARSRGNRGAQRNRAVTDVFEPGSTLKPFTVAVGIQTGIYDATSFIDTNPGRLRIGSHVVKDKRNYGRINLSTVLTKSSNVGVSKIALAVEPRDMWHTLSQLGLGQTTGSGFPGESAGILTPYKGWGDIHRATMAFGYGLSVTPLQLAQAYLAIANDGRMPTLSFQKLERAGGGRQVLEPQVAADVRAMLEGVVSPQGTARRAAIPGYRVAGKTGTVRKPTPGGYSKDRFMAIFAGMAPASSPRLVAVVVVDEPGGEQYYGGQVAAPVFRDVMAGALRLLGIPPDKPEELGGAELSEATRG
jgi:cell division protein FtsI (penicillin-binding protein 3)